MRDDPLYTSCGIKEGSYRYGKIDEKSHPSDLESRYGSGISEGGTLGFPFPSALRIEFQMLLMLLFLLFFAGKEASHQ